MCCLIVRRNKTLGLVQQENHCEKAGVKGNSPTSGYDPIQVEQGAEKLIKAQFWIAKKRKSSRDARMSDGEYKPTDLHKALLYQ